MRAQLPIRPPTHSHNYTHRKSEPMSLVVARCAWNDTFKHTFFWLVGDGSFFLSHSATATHKLSLSLTLPPFFFSFVKLFNPNEIRNARRKIDYFIKYIAFYNHERHDRYAWHELEARTQPMCSGTYTQKMRLICGADHSLPLQPQPFHSTRNSNDRESDEREKRTKKPNQIQRSPRKCN